MNVKRLIMLIPFAIAAGAGARAANLTVCPAGCQHTTIQGAISHANDGDRIYIGKGHYFEAVNTRGKSLSFLGSDTREVVIDANGNGTVITIPGGAVAITGVTITRGHGAGGGIAVTGSASLELSSSIVVSNYSTTTGGGLNLGNSESTVTISYCTIANNEAALSGGGLYVARDVPGTYPRSVTIDTSTIAKNASGLGGTSAFAGGGIAIEGNFVDATITNSSIVDNFSGGISVTSDQASNTLAVSDSTIAGNTSEGNGGGVLLLGGTATLRNVDISRNGALSGGGIFASPNGASSAQIELISTYVTGNTASIDGGGTDLEKTTFINGGVIVVTGNHPDNCAKGTTCP